MTTKTVTIQNTVGLHARPATFFIQEANSYKSTVMIEKGTRRANAKSLLGVLSLGIEKGHDITIRAEGIDEAEAVEGLANLLLTGFND
ncbi:MAG: HPr family phosphocarrier protein [Clostridia bacterium]|nr:HPr family phosphocarrier protein [Clostridia bacterium]MBQ7048684.1 HPr family phosphocarrier protein [Clostridia bacterium]